MGGLDAEGDNLTVGRRRYRSPARFAEFVGLADDVIGRSTSTSASRLLSAARTAEIATARPESRHGLEHYVGLDPALTQLLGDDETEVGVGNDNRTGKRLGVVGAPQHLLERRCGTDDRDELLWHALP